MKHFWPAKRFSIVAAILSVLFFAHPAPTLAAGCPTTPVSEQGGSHWCYDAGSSGHVQLWTPGNFNASTASTVVYIHGYNLGDCPSAHYIDCAWDKHSLASQFSASGLNALFVAIEAPISNAELSNPGVRWSSLGSLLQSIKTNGGVTPGNAVTGIAHSGGIFTVTKFMGDGRMTHLVLLDTMYGEESKVKGWFNQGSSLKLTLVGAESQNAQSKAVGQQLGCTTVTNVPSSFAADALSARCVYLDSKLGHMQTVTGGRVIPLALSRTGAPTVPGGTAPTTPGSSGGGLVTIPSTSTTYEPPRFEIPIPGVTLTSFTGTDSYSLPWIGQYIQGVYTFLIGIVGMVAAVMMIIAGFQYLTSAGDSGKIKAAKKRIFDAIAGLVLALGSYVILYTINPELVQFKALDLLAIKTTTLADDGKEDNIIQVVAADPAPVGSGTKPQTLCTNKAACLAYCNGKQADVSKVPSSTPGMATPSQVKVIPNTAGINGYGKSTSQATIDLLKKAGELAAAEGYKIGVGSGYRPLLEQVRLVCAAYAENRDSQVGRTIAWPGGSFHGVGFAIDVSLWKDGQKLTISGDSVGQQQEDPAEARKLADIMIKAGFRRLNNEIWHFEPANAPTTSCRCYTLENCSMPPNVKC